MHGLCESGDSPGSVSAEVDSESSETQEGGGYRMACWDEAPHHSHHQQIKHAEGAMGDTMSLHSEVRGTSLSSICLCSYPTHQPPGCQDTVRLPYVK